MKSHHMIILFLCFLMIIGCQESLTIPEFGKSENQFSDDIREDEEFQNVYLHIFIDSYDDFKVTSINDVVNVLLSLNTDQMSQLGSIGKISIDSEETSICLLSLILSYNSELSLNSSSNIVILAGSWGCMKKCIALYSNSPVLLENCLKGCDNKVDPNPTKG